MIFQYDATNQVLPKSLLPYDRSSETIFSVILLKFYNCLLCYCSLNFYVLKPYNLDNFMYKAFFAEWCYDQNLIFFYIVVAFLYTLTTSAVYLFICFLTIFFYLINS